MSFVLGIDTSTTATKALVMDGAGRIVAVGRSGYGYETPHPLWSEQDPHLWWSATVEAIRSALALAGIDGSDIQSIGVTGQMHGLVLLDEDLAVVRPAILWNDQRTWRECDEIRSRYGRGDLIATTGNDALPGFTAPKILWVRNNEPDAYARARHVLLPKDFVRLELTGELATDKAGGSGTVMFDLAARNWSPALLASLDIDPSMLPTAFEGPETTGVVSPHAAELTGLAPGTRVVAGAGDQAANAVGVGAVNPGVVAMSVGTSGVVFAATEEPAYEPEGRLHAFCHAVADRWHLMGVMLSAAGSLQWFHDAVTPNEDFAALTHEAAGAAGMDDGLFFLPYLSGERTPHADPYARGAFVGLTVRHERGSMVRALLEGVAFGLKDSMDLIEASVPVGEVRVSGGGAVSDVWLQIIADTLGKPLHRLGTSEGAAQGAAILAGVGSGMFASVDDAAGTVSIDATIEPTDSHDRYLEGHARFKELYRVLAPTFRPGPESDLG